MQVRVCDRNEYTMYERDTLYLHYDNWDDYHFKTSFNARYVDGNRKEYAVGPVKIGMVNMDKGKIFDHIPKSFTALPEQYFSLGQEEQYYENIVQLGEEKRKHILAALRDVAYNLELFQKYEKEIVMMTSLMRSITPFTVRLQFNRMAHGGARLTKYNFTYSPQKGDTDQTTDGCEISFSVTPDSNPPTNVHVLIGRNGTGKTSLIKNMIHSIRESESSHGTFHYEGRILSRAEFANVLCVAFSPFDDFSELETIESTIPYSYIGLNKTSADLLQTIERQFLESFTECMVNARKRKLWLNAIDVLKSDPTFDEVHIESLVENMPVLVSDGTFANGQEEIKRTFSKLSSGHKVVLLIVTCCVDKIEEKSIVFLDEPENHLHPPLLSALIRALSELLIDRNGVAIVSTHSPVVLQEVPSSCVWTLRRCGGQMITERLAVQTFGSSISQLTNEVFGLEVTDSGFHKMLAEAVRETSRSVFPVKDYDRIVSEFDGQLGDEAKLHLRTLLAVRTAQEE